MSKKGALAPEVAMRHAPARRQPPRADGVLCDSAPSPPAQHSCLDRRPFVPKHAQLTLRCAGTARCTRGGWQQRTRSPGSAPTFPARKWAARWRSCRRRPPRRRRRRRPAPPAAAAAPTAPQPHRQPPSLRGPDGSQVRNSSAGSFCLQLWQPPCSHAHRLLHINKDTCWKLVPHLKAAALRP